MFNGSLWLGIWLAWGFAVLGNILVTLASWSSILALRYPGCLPRVVLASLPGL